MTTFNGAKLIKQSVESILGQTFPDFELLVVNDSSPDNTGRVLREYRDPRLRIVGTGRNRGVVGSRNFGVGLARGRYIAPLDHDDIARPTRLAKQVAFLEANPAIALVGTCSHDFENGELRPAEPQTSGPPWLIDFLLHLRNPLPYSSIMFRSEVLAKLGVFVRKERLYADDFDFYHRLLRLHPGSIARLEDRLVVYRRHAGNTSRPNVETMHQSSIKVLSDAYREWFADEAERMAELVAGAGWRLPNGRADLTVLGSFLERLGDEFSRTRGLSAEDRVLVREMLGREWVSICIAAARSGHLGAILELRKHLGVGNPGLVATLRLAANAAAGFASRTAATKQALRRFRGGAPGPTRIARRPDRLFGHTYRRAALEDDRPPTMYVVVDTGAEFDFSQPFSRDQDTVSALAGLPRAQALFDQVGLRPIYLVDYPIAARPDAASVIRDIHQRGGCEVGVHLQPWTTPPFEETIPVRNSFPGNLPRDLEAQKLESNLAAVRDAFGVQPLFYKSGRYGIGPNTIEIIAGLGFKVDFSVMPCTDLRPAGGPDMRSLRPVPYEIDGTGLLSLPMTRGATGLLGGLGRRFGDIINHPVVLGLNIRGLLALLRIYNIATLTPEGNTIEEQRRLVTEMLRCGHRVFVLHYHSPSLVAGNTPYVRTATDEAAFFGRLEGIFDFFFTILGGLPGTPNDLLPPLLRPPAPPRAMPLRRFEPADRSLEPERKGFRPCQAGI